MEVLIKGSVNRYSLWNVLVTFVLILHIRDLSEANLALKVAMNLLQEYKKIIFNEKMLK